VSEGGGGERKYFEKRWVEGYGEIVDIFQKSEEESLKKKMHTTGRGCGKRAGGENSGGK